MACAGCDAPGDVRLCGACLAEVRLRPIRAGDEAGVPVTGHALAGYDSGIGRALLRAKYGADRSLMRALAELLAREAADAAMGCDALVPAPSPWDRRARRGFAPSAVLADALSAATGLPVVHALAMARGARQAALDASGRGQNLRGRLRSVAPVEGRVLLVDDVVTTGATLGMCASELLGDRTAGVAALVLCAAELSRPIDDVRKRKHPSAIVDTMR
jgi:ComF family protein